MAAWTASDVLLSDKSSKPHRPAKHARRVSSSAASVTKRSNRPAHTFLTSAMPCCTTCKPPRKTPCTRELYVCNEAAKATQQAHAQPGCASQACRNAHKYVPLNRSSHQDSQGPVGSFWRPPAGTQQTGMTPRCSLPCAAAPAILLAPCSHRGSSPPASRTPRLSGRQCCTADLSAVLAREVHLQHDSVLLLHNRAGCKQQMCARACKTSMGAA